MKRIIIPVMVLLLVLSTIARSTTYFYPASRRHTPTPTPTSTPTVLTSTLVITSISNGLTFSNYHISTTTGPCVELNNTTGVTIQNFQIGPCGTGGTNFSEGVIAFGGGSNKVYDSYIHCGHAGSSSADKNDGVFLEDETNDIVQGNVIWDCEDPVTLINDRNAGTYGPVTINGNFLLNPRGVFPKGQQIQITTGAGGNISGATITNNRTLSCNATSTCTTHPGESPATGVSCLACSASSMAGVSGLITSYGVMEDSINVLGSVNNTVTGNWVEGGDAANGCGTAIDIGSTTSTVSNNIYKDAGHCGINIANGNATVNGNKGQNTTMINGAGGQWGMEFATFGQPGYIPGTVNFANNIFSWLAGGTVYCNPNTTSCTFLSYTGPANGFVAVDNGGNQFDNTTALHPTVWNILNPITSTNPPPLIPPVPKNCVANSPFTTQTSMALCP